MHVVYLYDLPSSNDMLSNKLQSVWFLILLYQKRASKSNIYIFYFIHIASLFAKWHADNFKGFDEGH